MLQKLVLRFSEKAGQIQDYIESTNSIQVSDQDLSGTLSVAPRFTGHYSSSFSTAPQDSYLPFGSLDEGDLEASLELPNDDEEEEGFSHNTGVIWRGLDQLLNLLPSPRRVKAMLPGAIGKGTVAEQTPPPADTPTNLETSFILVPRADESVDLNQSMAPAPPAVSPDTAQYLAEIEKLKLANKLLTQQNTKLRKMCTPRTGMHELLQENTMLKKSISNFRHQVQKQSELWRQSSRSMMVPRLEDGVSTIVQAHSNHSTISPLPSQDLSNPETPAGETNISYLSKRVRDLEATLRALYTKLSAKESELQELAQYKQRYQEVKREARKKRHEKKATSEAVSTSIVDSNCSSSASL